MILDRHGQLLATSEASYCASLVPAEMQEPEGTMTRLARLLHLPREEIRARLPDENRRQSFVPLKVKEHLSPAETASLEEQRVNLPGVIVETELIRRYLQPGFAAHILGHVGEISREELDARRGDRKVVQGDITGKAGMERVYDADLLGDKGSIQVQTDARGNPIARVGRRDERVGRSLFLTLDASLQEEAERLLAASGRRGALVLMKVKNGELLALANHPDFDPNMFSRPITNREWRSLTEDKAHPLLNRAVASQYPPGSTFKMVTACAGLNLNLISTQTRFRCTGSLHVGRRFRCSGVHGSVDLTRALARSCNVYFMTVGRLVGARRLARYARELGLGVPTGVDLPREGPGLIPDEEWKRGRVREGWYTGDTLNMSIGQGFTLVTPLQLACVVSAIANQGNVPIPHLMKEVRGLNDDVVKTNSGKTRATSIRASVLASVREGMRQAVLAGTATALRTPAVTIAAKTGSAQNVHGPRTHAWVACFAPYENPEVACVVLLENAGHGGAAAAPVARKMLERVFRK